MGVRGTAGLVQLEQAETAHPRSSKRGDMDVDVGNLHGWAEREHMCDRWCFLHELGNKIAREKRTKKGLQAGGG